MPLPKDNALRKALPLFTFLTEYFPDAILELVKVSVAGNMQHNPGEPMHWARGKSMDQLNTAQRHMWDYATTGMYNDEPPLPPEILAAIGGTPPMHLANAAWRLLAQIQLDCEARANAQEKLPDPGDYLEPRATVAGVECEPYVSTGAFVHDPLNPTELIADMAAPVLTMACGCVKRCKGHAADVVPTGTGPRDPEGNPYRVNSAPLVYEPPVATSSAYLKGFDPAD